MSDLSSSGMSTDSKGFNRQKVCKTYSKTANEWYLASALYDGVEDGNLRQLTTLLMSKGANPNIVLPEYGVAPIHLAAGLEDTQFGREAMKLFLCHGGDPNVRSTDGMTPVHIASLWGRSLTLQLLLANGGDPWLFDNDKKNAFSYAHEQQQWETFKLLDSFKNAIIQERPEISKKSRYKLCLDRVKVFNNDICAEYKALPKSLKCCSTQTPSLKSRKKNSSVTSVDLEQDITEKMSMARVPAPPDIDLTIKNSYDYREDAFNMKFNLCPNEQELKALELVRKHRQGITVFEYVPESGYKGDCENISVYLGENSSRSVENDNHSVAGSMNSLIRGSVFADVKSKLKLFYKNMSGHNDNKECSWRINLIQKRKDKEKLKKDLGKVISSCENFTDRSNKKKCKETHSDVTNYFQLKNSSSHIKCKESYKSFANGNKTDGTVSEVETSHSKKSSSSLWKFKFSDKQKEKTSSNNNNDDDAVFQLDSFHRFEDVIDSYKLHEMNDQDVVEENYKANGSSKSDKSSENIRQYITESICMDILRRINSRTHNTNEIGFLLDEHRKNCPKNVSDNLLIHNNKRDIGFYFDEPVKSICNAPLNEGEKVLDDKSKDVKASCSNVPDITTDIEPDISVQKNAISGDNIGKWEKRKQFFSNEFDNSVILTDDESTATNVFVCYNSKNSVDKNSSNINNSVVNDSNLNSTKTSATDVYFSCTSVDNSKDISFSKDDFIDAKEDTLYRNLSSNISRNHIEGISVYESDNLNEKETDDILNTAFNDSKTVTSITPDRELIYESDCQDSKTAVLGSPKPSLSESYEVSSIVSADNCISDPNSPFGDHNLLSEPGPSSTTENVDIVPRIKIPDETSSCSEGNIPKVSCNRTHSLQMTTGHKWTYADIISSDEETDISIIEEYLYTDEEEGIELVEERHLPVTSSSKLTMQTEGDKELQQTKEPQTAAKKITATSTETESESALSSVDTAYETDELRRELKELGFTAGPITGGTKKVYLRQLKRARRKPVSLNPLSPRQEYSSELERLLRTDKDLIVKWAPLEIEMSKPFQCPDPKKRWREGVAKTSFTYLLLDPRVTQDLPHRANSLSSKERLNCFLQAIFYVGRGKRTRPYSHLTEALAVWNRWKHVSSKKVNKILDIWGSGQGVVCLHVFQNVIPVEAMTREAAMIDALGLQVLSNERIGDYYAAASTWNLRQRQQLGAVLLARALNVLIGEGERQIRPPDIE